MTSAHALTLANKVTKNDPAAIQPLIQLLCAFRDSAGDPEGEAMMDDVIKSQYLKTDHCDKALREYVSIAA